VSWSDLRTAVCLTYSRAPAERPAGYPRVAVDPQFLADFGDGEERQTSPRRRHHLDLEPLPDVRGGDLAAG
jgi:hypothetical protein